MIVVKNTHEAIVSQELWDRVREMEQSVSQGKRNSDGYVVIVTDSRMLHVFWQMKSKRSE